MILLALSDPLRGINEFVLLWTLSAAISALMPPDSKSSEVYVWAYRFLHLVAANLDRAGVIGCNSQISSREPRNSENNTDTFSK